jgi:hypothetical protein
MMLIGQNQVSEGTLSGSPNAKRYEFKPVTLEVLLVKGYAGESSLAEIIDGAATKDTIDTPPWMEEWMERCKTE